MKTRTAPLIMSALLLLAGCATVVTPPAPKEFPRFSRAPLPLTVGVSMQEHDLPILDEGYAKSSIEELSRFVQILREANVFKEVRFPLTKPEEQEVDLVLSLRMTTRYDGDSLYVLKAFVNAFTITLMSPVLRAKDGWRAKARVTVKDRAGDELRQYNEAQEVRTSWNMVSGWPERGRSAHDHVTARLIQSIIDDRPLFEKASAQRRTGDPVAGGPAEAPRRPAGPASSDVDVPARRAAERPDDFAVVVGIERYSNELPDALFAERDAEAARSHFLALGVPDRNIKFLTGARATKGNLEAYLQDWLPRNVTESGRVFFYFSGHGAPDPDSGRAYLIPSDGDPTFLEKTAYPLKRLYADLGGLKAGRVFVVLDSCFSGAGGRSVLAKGTRPLVGRVDTGIGAGGKLVLFAAASEKETTGALEDQGHGIFTYYFLKGLGGEARDAAGAVTIRGLHDYLRPKVQDAASRQNREQRPVMEGPDEGEIVRYR